MQTLEKYRDTILKIVIVIATAFIGYATDTDRNPRFDAEVLTWLILIASCFCCLAFITDQERKNSQHDEIIERLDKTDRQYELLIVAQQQTMRTSLIHMAEKYISRGWITSEELKAWSDMYKAYSKLGLNGYVKSYMNKIYSLEIRTMNDLY